MASELAANTLHARAVAGTGGGGDRFVSVAPDRGGEPISSAGPAPHNPHSPQDPAVLPPAPQGCPELWLYLRGLGTRRELVCKVFDCSRGWRHGSVPSAVRVSAQAVSGRGLTVWCRSGIVSLTSPEGDRKRWSYADLVEAAEQTVRCYEELELGLDLAVAGA